MLSLAAAAAAALLYVRFTSDVPFTTSALYERHQLDGLNEHVLLLSGTRSTRLRQLIVHEHSIAPCDLRLDEAVCDVID